MEPPLHPLVCFKITNEQSSVARNVMHTNRLSCLDCGLQTQGRSERPIAEVASQRPLSIVGHGSLRLGYSACGEFPHIKDSSLIVC